MVINNFIEKRPAGLYCIAGDFYLDPRRSTTISLVSHAHGDHAVASKGEVYCTAPTRSFMEHRHGIKSKTSFNVVQYGVSSLINNVEVTFYPAGHILGSAQILMQFEGKKYLYTGDFKISGDESCETFEFIECDFLITETTFASPDYFHPDPCEELQKLLQLSDKIVIGAYSLGKAQRITHLISKYCPEVSVFIHPDLEPYHRLYETHGYPTGSWKTFRRDDFARPGKSIYVVPPFHFRKYDYQADALRVFATGWKKSFYRCDRVLAVSDHADWPGILELIRKTKASRIYTVHGNGRFLKDHLQDEIEVTLMG